MDIQALIYFSEVAKKLNYSKAAETSYISRQALKQQIQSLERELGVALFVNIKNHLQLTGEGDYLYRNCQAVIREYRELQQKLKEMPRGKKIRLGICSALIPMQYMVGAAEFQQFEQNNACQVERQLLTIDECMESLAADELDAAYLFALDDPLSVYAKYPVYESPVYIDYSKNIQVKKGRLAAEELVSYPFMIMGKPEYTIAPLWRDLQAKGLTFSYEINVNTIETFYHVMQGSRVIFDLEGGNEESGLPGVSASILDGYRFFVGLLARWEYPDRELLTKLQQFLKAGYPFIKKGNEES